VSSARMTRIRKYREEAFSTAALIAAIIAARYEDNSPLVALRQRQDDHLHDLLHDFAFKSRKLIELASAQGIPAIDWANAQKIIGFQIRSTDSLIQKFEHYSLWFVLGRLIHSDNLRIVRSPVQLSSDQIQITHELPWALVVRSDYDINAQKQHFVFIDELLKSFITLVDQLDQNLRLTQGSSE